MEVRAFTKAGKINNEDSCYVCDEFGFVIDGATGVTSQKVSCMQTDAQWFSFAFRDYLITALKDKTKNLKQIVSEGIEFVDKQFYEFDGADAVTSKPSAAIAIFRIMGDEIEYFVLGDCTVIFNGDDAKNFISNDLVKSDLKNIQILISRAKENNINVVDARPLVNDVLYQTRQTKNTPSGYWILADDPKAVNYAEYGFVKKQNIKQVLALSDGFSQVYDLFKIYSMKEFADKLYYGMKIEKMYDILYKNQEKDKFCNNFPRFKLRDDATIVELKL